MVELFKEILVEVKSKGVTGFLSLSFHPKMGVGQHIYARIYEPP